MSIGHRINFSQLARHTNAYCERTMRRHFERFVDFADINRRLIAQHGSGHFVLALDPTYLPKSGKKTPGVGKYWSGAVQKALWGLEVSLLSVVDVDKRTAWHLDAVQTPSLSEREGQDISLTDHYAQTVAWQADNCRALSGYLAADAYFAKAGFIDRVCDSTGLHIVSRLRKDASLRYLYDGPRSGGRGRPRLYAGKVDWAKPCLLYTSRCV